MASEAPERDASGGIERQPREEEGQAFGLLAEEGPLRDGVMSEVGGMPISGK